MAKSPQQIKEFKERFKHVLKECGYANLAALVAVMRDPDTGEKMGDARLRAAVDRGSITQGTARELRRVTGVSMEWLNDNVGGTAFPGGPIRKPEERLTVPGGKGPAHPKLGPIRSFHDATALQMAIAGLFEVLERTRPDEALAVAQAIAAQEGSDEYLDGITLGPLLLILGVTVSTTEAGQKVVVPLSPSPSMRKQA